MIRWTDDEKLRVDKLIQTAKISKDTAWYEKNVIPKIINNKSKYKFIADQIGCPLSFVALVHFKENAADLGRFLSYLGNGQPWNKKTTIVPKGRGPFISWESGAIDALKLVGVDGVTSWTLPKMIYQLEAYNGFGYRARGVNTPYVWSYTNHHTKGLFVSDGKYDANAISKNMGCFALYSLLISKDKDFIVGKPITKIEVEPVKPKSFYESLLEMIDILFKSMLGGPKSDAPAVESDPSPLVPIKLTAYEWAKNEGTISKIPGHRHNARILYYHSFTTLNAGEDEVAWCSSLMCAAQESVGNTSTKSAAARSWLKWGKDVSSNPVVGDVIVLWRGSATGWQGHVGFLAKPYKKSDVNVWIFGGNQSDSLNESAYSANQILGFRRV